MPCPQSVNFLLQCGTVFLLALFAAMNCKQIFLPDTHNQLPKKQHNLLIGGLIGCACVLGGSLMIAVFVGLALIPFSLDEGGVDFFDSDSVSVRAGEEFNLYGKTIQDENFDWESLRGKYVLVKFTATWCGPCRGEIPGMLEAYEKYHDKGLEIVSVYVWEQEPDAVATVKNYVEEKKLPWIIISESLTKQAGQAPQGEAFDIQGVPTMLLIDKEGKIITERARGAILKEELKKLFE